MIKKISYLCILLSLCNPSYADIGQFTIPGTISNYADRRINLSNTGTYPSDSDIIWQGDANRWYREIPAWNSPGNDASFVFSSRVNSVGPNFGPVHGGVWSELSCYGGPSACFAFMSSGHRRGAGPMYGIHSEIWDESKTPGLSLAYNAELAQTPLTTNPTSVYIGYNMQIGPTAKNADGFQVQSVAGANPVNYNAVITGDANARYGLDFSRINISSDGAIFNLSPNHTVENSRSGGYIKAKIGGKIVKIPFYY